MRISIFAIAALISSAATAGTITLKVPAGFSGNLTYNADGSVTVASPMLNYKGVLYYINGDASAATNATGICAWVLKTKYVTPVVPAKTGSTSLLLSTAGVATGLNSATSYTIGSVTCG